MLNCKRWMAVLLVICMLLSLCACGKNDTHDPEGSVPQNPQQDSWMENDPAPSDDETVQDPEPTEPVPEDPKPTDPEPDTPTNSDGATCYACGAYLDDWFPLNEGCGQVINWHRSCPNGCGGPQNRYEMNWHTLENGVCTRCGKGESDPANLGFKLNEDGTGYLLTSVSHDHHDQDLIVPRTYNGLPVVGVKDFYAIREDHLQPYYIYLPDTITSLQDQAFMKSRIVAVWMPDTLTQIGSKTFMNCQSLTYLRWSENLTTVGDYAFSASGLQTVTLPDSTRTIGSAAFMNCSILAGVTLNNGLTSIGEAAFCRTLLGTVELPDSIRTMGPTTFAYNTYLQSINIPKSLSFIPSDCFYECTALSNVVWHDDIVFIDSSAFAMTAISELPLLPKLQGLGRWAFSDCDSLVKISLPEGLRTIPANAFEKCKVLAELNLPSSLLRIHKDAFYLSHNVDTTLLPVLPTEITSNADGCTCSNGHLMSDWELVGGQLVTCHDSATRERYCLTCGETVQKTELMWHNLVHDVCTECGVQAAPAEQLTFRLNDAGTGYIFTGVEGNTYESSLLIIPSTYQGLPVVEVEAFGKPNNSWYKLRTVYISEGVTKLHAKAAEGCNLYSLYLPDSLEEVPESLCDGGNAQYLANVRFGAGLKKIGVSAFSSGELTWVDLPDGLQEIGAYAFSGNEKLSGVTMPESVVLGKNVFAGTPLESRYAN